MADKEKRLVILGNGNNGGGGGTQVQSDWTETDTTKKSYIKNKPSLATVATSGSYNDLTNKPTIPTLTSQLTNDSGYLTEHQSLSGYATETWVGQQGYLTEHQNLKTINNQSIVGTGNITIEAAEQVQANWNESDITSKAYIVNKPSLATVATTGSYNDLTNKPTIPAAQIQSDWTESDITSKAYIVNKPSLATVATTGSYNDLTNKPTIPTLTSQLTNDSGYLTQHQSLSGYATETWVGQQGYLTSQTKANWDETDTTSAAYIQNKPSMSTETLTFIDSNNIETTVIVYIQPSN